MKGVFEIEERSHDEKIMRRLSEHLDAVKEKHPEWVGIFLQGSQNYKLDYEGSDVDSKLIVLPSFEDFVLNRKPYSYTHIMENDEHVDVKDIRLMFDCFRKQNINFVEILFTKYRILNPKYASLFQPVLDSRELIGRYNDFASLNCMVGTAMEKQKALCHPYPATIDNIGKAFTKAFKNSNGEDTDIAHYYEHHHVSAYDSLFYTQPALDVLYVAGVIQWHMRPFELERVPHAEKAVAKFKRLIGDKMYADVMALHEADIKAKMAPAEETK